MISPKNNQKRILLVDDDPVVLRMVEARLKEAGFDVLKFIQASDGLQSAIKNPPDLIVLDVMMPIINGYNFCKLLKSEMKENKIPIMFLTSRIDEEDIKIGFEMGADAYLTKPVDMNALITKIKELLGV